MKRYYHILKDELDYVMSSTPITRKQALTILETHSEWSKKPKYFLDHSRIVLISMVPFECILIDRGRPVSGGQSQIQKPNVEQVIELLGMDIEMQEI